MPYGPRPQSERNAAILAAHKGGKSMRTLAAEYGVSTARIHQIIVRERARQEKQPA